MSCLMCEEQKEITTDDFIVRILNSHLQIIHPDSHDRLEIQISFCPFCGSGLKNEVNKHLVAEKIKGVRLKLGLSQKEFAKEFEEQPPSKGTISKWENGRYLPNNKRLKVIAEIGNTTAEDLLGGKL